MNLSRITKIAIATFALIMLLSVPALAAGGGWAALFSGNVYDGPGGPGVTADVHLTCTDGTDITVRSWSDGWYQIITDDNPAAYCTLWATSITDTALSSGRYGMTKSAWNHQDLTLTFYFLEMNQNDER